MVPKTEPIPQPPKAPLVGNLADMNVKFPLDSMINLTDKYGPIFKLNLPGVEFVAVSDWSMVNEVCDDSRFRKSIQGELEVSSCIANLHFGFHSLTEILVCRNCD